MLTRRDFLQVAAATAGMGLLNRTWASTSNRIRFEELTAFDPVGQVTLLNFTDIHAQLMPLYYREPSSNLGVGDMHGLPPHITGSALLQHFGLKAGSSQAHAFTHGDFERLARSYGRVGGIAHMATLIKQSAPIALIGPCWWIAATPGRAPTPRCKPTVWTWWK